MPIHCTAVIVYRHFVLKNEIRKTYHLRHLCSNGISGMKNQKSFYKFDSSYDSNGISGMKTQKSFLQMQFLL